MSGILEDFRPKVNKSANSVRRFAASHACLFFSKTAEASRPVLVKLAALFLLALIPLGCGGSSGIQPSPLDPTLTLLTQYSFQKNTSVYSNAANIAFDGDTIYLSSPDSEVYETSSLDSNSPLNLIFQPPGSGIAGLYVANGVLYVMVTPRPGMADHTLYESTDHGQTFQPADGGLQCTDRSCYYMPVSEMSVQGNLIYVNAGGGFNLYVSSDGGQTYQLLYGLGNVGPCTQNYFEILGSTVLMGGECKLDIAYLYRGVLSADGLSWAVPLAPVQSPALGNRKINVIERNGTTSLVLVGAEGSMLRSLDGGQSFIFDFEYQFGPPDPYPYTGTILFPAGQCNLVLAAGWDKASKVEAPYLAYSSTITNANQWNDISYLFGAGAQRSIVTQLAQDQNGRIIAILVNVLDKTVYVYQIGFTSGSCPSQ